MVLVVLLVLIEREVLIDVFYVGLSLVGCAVFLWRSVGIYGVTIRIVDMLVAVSNGKLLAIIV